MKPRKKVNYQENTKTDPLLSFRVKDRRLLSKLTVDQQENEAAELVGGKRHSGSGSQIFTKSDASSKDYQVECKQTCAASMGVKLSWLRKIGLEAEGKGKEPVLHIRFTKESQEQFQDWVMIRESEFKRLIEGR